MLPIRPPALQSVRGLVPRAVGVFGGLLYFVSRTADFASNFFQPKVSLSLEA
ncbi:hypothetical protein [Streptomyces sp. NBC_00842]|uniref:hypothetical protein n=1 Tax=Streptomyces sp. NBC_00842 TaxID=2975848 RepID=UPI00386F0766|nr:hypothetical protein OH821_40590 [Streptomyces sp. NBC_00842]